MHQVHGADVAVVPGAGPATAGPPTCDALVTTDTGVALLARAADCVPVLLGDPDAGVVAAVHSGRHGLAAGVVPAAVARMRDLGARRVTAWVGPHVCGACYEVPEEMRDEVAAAVPEAWSTTRWDTPGARPRRRRPRPARPGRRRTRSTTSASAPSRTTRGPPTGATAPAATRFAGVVWMHA